MKKLFITTILLFSFFTTKFSFAVDWSVAYRCNETYHFKIPCYPFDATFRADPGTGVYSCICPAGGCRQCGQITTSTGTVPAEDCNFPFPILDKVSQYDLTLKATIRTHYKTFGYDNSCGENNWQELNGFLNDLDIFNLAPEEASGSNITNVIDVKFTALENPSNYQTLSFPFLDTVSYDGNTTSGDPYPSSTRFKIRSFLNSRPYSVGKGESYGVLPRLEDITDASGNKMKIIRFYISESGKVDLAHLGENNLHYFHFRNCNMSNLGGWTIFGGHCVWRSMQYCESFNDLDASDSDGDKTCKNNPYIQSLFAIPGDTRSGLKMIKPAGPGGFPAIISLYQGGAVTLASPPALSYSPATGSNFLNPKINVIATDAGDSTHTTASNPTTLEGSGATATLTHATIWNYQLETQIVNNLSPLLKPKLCLYACRLNPTGTYCLNNNSRSLSTLLSSSDNTVRAEAEKFLVRYSNNQACMPLPDITGANSIYITGLGIGSTIASPKVRVKVTQGTDVSNNLDLTLPPYKVPNGSTANTATESMDLVNLQTVPQLDSTKMLQANNKSVVQAYVFKNHSMKQNITASGITQNLQFCKNFDKLGSSCTRSTASSTNVAEVTCSSDSCSGLSSTDDDFICVYNVYNDSNTRSLSQLAGLSNPDVYIEKIDHPMSINNSSIINNTYYDYKKSEDATYSGNENLCIPIPKIEPTFSFVMTDYNKNSPDSRVTMTRTINGNVETKTLDFTNVPIVNSIENRDFRFDYYLKYKVQAHNNAGIYCMSKAKYNSPNSTTHASLTQFGSCQNLNRCPLTNPTATPRATYPNATTDPVAPLTVAQGGLTSGWVGPTPTASTPNPTQTMTGTCPSGASQATVTSECDKDGNWTTSSGQCLMTCPATTQTVSETVAGASFNIDYSFSATQGNNIGDKSVSINNSGCAPGYSGVKTGTMDCQDDGTWDTSSISTNYTCAEIQCPGGNAGITRATFATTAAPIDLYYPDGNLKAAILTTVTGTCPSGAASATVTAQCNSSGNWVNQTGTCQLQCPAQTTSGFSLPLTTANNSGNLNVSVTKGCGANYSGQYSATVICKDDGTWDTTGLSSATNNCTQCAAGAWSNNDPSYSSLAMAGGTSYTASCNETYGTSSQQYNNDVTFTCSSSGNISIDASACRAKCKVGSTWYNHGATQIHYWTSGWKACPVYVVVHVGDDMYREKRRGTCNNGSWVHTGSCISDLDTCSHPNACNNWTD